jgi:hypothetical protein
MMMICDDDDDDDDHHHHDLIIMIMMMISSQVAKKKVFEKLAPGLATDERGVANYKGSPFTIAGSGEVCTAPLPNAHVA